MTSPYIAKILTSIQSASTLDEQLSLRSEYAGALARYGQVDQATEEIRSLRKANASYAPATTSWILIAEGQVSHFKSLAPSALASFRAAHAIASRIGRNDIAAVAGAWMAASEYVAGDVKSAAKHAIDALAQGETTSRASQSRAHLVIADCLSCAGSTPTAQEHYALARRFAIEDGDISMQSLVFFNAAAFGTTELILQDCFGNVSPDRIRAIELQLESVANLDKGIGLSSLNALIPLLKAECLGVSRRWKAAIDLYEVALTPAEQQGQDRWLSKHLGSFAYCLARQGQLERSATTAEEATRRFDGRTDPDSRAIAHMRLAQTFELLGNSVIAGKHRSNATADYEKHIEYQRILRAELPIEIERQKK